MEGPDSMNFSFVQSFSLQGSYYPTMPQDDFIDLQKALAAGKTKNPDDYELAFYSR